MDTIYRIILKNTQSNTQATIASVISLESAETLVKSIDLSNHPDAEFLIVKHIFPTNEKLLTVAAALQQTLDSWPLDAVIDGLKSTLDSKFKMCVVK